MVITWEERSTIIVFEVSRSQFKVTVVCKIKGFSAINSKYPLLPHIILNLNSDKTLSENWPVIPYNWICYGIYCSKCVQK